MIPPAMVCRSCLAVRVIVGVCHLHSQREEWRCSVCGLRLWSTTIQEQTPDEGMIVKAYPSRRDWWLDAQVMAAEGWEVVEQRPRREGCRGALLRVVRPGIVVRYQRSRPPRVRL